jgi:hypothetical protein
VGLTNPIHKGKNVICEMIQDASFRDGFFLRPKKEKIEVKLGSWYVRSRPSWGRVKWQSVLNTVMNIRAA